MLFEVLEKLADLVSAVSSMEALLLHGLPFIFYQVLQIDDLDNTPQETETEVDTTANTSSLNLPESPTTEVEPEFLSPNVNIPSIIQPSASLTPEQLHELQNITSAFMENSMQAGFYDFDSETQAEYDTQQAAFRARIKELGGIDSEVLDKLEQDSINAGQEQRRIQEQAQEVAEQADPHINKLMENAIKFALIESPSEEQRSQYEETKVEVFKELEAISEQHDGVIDIEALRAKEAEIQKTIQAQAAVSAINEQFDKNPDVTLDDLREAGVAKGLPDLEIAKVLVGLRSEEHVQTIIKETNKLSETLGVDALQNPEIYDNAVSGNEAIQEAYAKLSELERLSPETVSVDGLKTQAKSVFVNNIATRFLDERIDLPPEELIAQADANGITENFTAEQIVEYQRMQHESFELKISNLETSVTNFENISKVITRDIESLEKEVGEKRNALNPFTQMEAEGLESDRLAQFSRLQGFGGAAEVYTAGIEEAKRLKEDGQTAEALKVLDSTFNQGQEKLRGWDKVGQYLSSSAQGLYSETSENAFQAAQIVRNTTVGVVAGAVTVVAAPIIVPAGGIYMVAAGTAIGVGSGVVGGEVLDLVTDSFSGNLENHEFFDTVVQDAKIGAISGFGASIGLAVGIKLSAGAAVGATETAAASAAAAKTAQVVNTLKQVGAGAASGGTSGLATSSVSSASEVYAAYDEFSKTNSGNLSDSEFRENFSEYLAERNLSWQDVSKTILQETAASALGGGLGAGANIYRSSGGVVRHAIATGAEVSGNAGVGYGIAAIDGEVEFSELTQLTAQAFMGDFVQSGVDFHAGRQSHISASVSNNINPSSLTLPEIQTANLTRRNVDQIADSASRVSREQIGNVQEILARDDIIGRSEMDERVTTQVNFLHGSTDAVLDIHSRAGRDENIGIVYYEGEELRAANQIGHPQGDAYLDATNDAIREAWAEIDPEAKVFRGPNAGIVVQSSNFTAAEILAKHTEIQQLVQEKISNNPILTSAREDKGLLLSGGLRAGAADLNVSSISSREEAKVAYYQTLAGATAAAEFSKNPKAETNIHTLDEIVQSGNYDSTDKAIAANYNFIPPEAEAGTFFNIADQKQAVFDAWDALTGPMPDRDSQRLRVAEILAEGPKSPEEQSLHSAARVETVKYIAMTNRPGRFESNVQAVHAGEHVPILNTTAGNQLQIDLVRNGVPVYRADGDLDYLGPLFQKQQSELEAGVRNVNDELMNADTPYGAMFNNSAKNLRALEAEFLDRQAVEVINDLPAYTESLNAERASAGLEPVDLAVEKYQIQDANGKASERYRVLVDGELPNADMVNALADISSRLEPTLITMAKQSSSDEYQLLVAGNNATPEHLREAMNIVRASVREVGLENSFPKIHKITGEEIGEGGTTTTLGTDYRPLNETLGDISNLSDADVLNHLESVAVRNDQIVNLRKFTRAKDTSGDLNDLTVEQVAEIEQTMNGFVDFYARSVAVPAYENGRTVADIKADYGKVDRGEMRVEVFQETYGVTPDSVKKGLNAVNDVEIALEDFGTPHDPEIALAAGEVSSTGSFGDVLSPRGLDVEAMKARIDSVTNGTNPLVRNSSSSEDMEILSSGAFAARAANEGVSIRREDSGLEYFFDSEGKMIVNESRNPKAGGNEGVPEIRLETDEYYQNNAESAGNHATIIESVRVDLNAVDEKISNAAVDTLIDYVSKNPSAKDEIVQLLNEAADVHDLMDHREQANYIDQRLKELAGEKEGTIIEMPAPVVEKPFSEEFQTGLDRNLSQTMAANDRRIEFADDGNSVSIMWKTGGNWSEVQRYERGLNGEIISKFQAPFTNTVKLTEHNESFGTLIDYVNKSIEAASEEVKTSQREVVPPETEVVNDKTVTTTEISRELFRPEIGFRVDIDRTEIVTLSDDSNLPAGLTIDSPEVNRNWDGFDMNYEVPKHLYEEKINRTLEANEPYLREMQNEFGDEPPVTKPENVHPIFDEFGYEDGIHLKNDYQKEMSADFVHPMTQEPVPTHYFDNQTREHYQVGPNTEGQLVWVNRDNQPVVDTAGEAIVSMDLEGNTFIVPEAAIEENFAGLNIHHSSALGERAAGFAGAISVENGQIRVVSNESGHYIPDARRTQAFVGVLNRQNIDLSMASVLTRGPNPMDVPRIRGTAEEYLNIENVYNF